MSKTNEFNKRIRKVVEVKRIFNFHGSEKAEMTAISHENNIQLSFDNKCKLRFSGRAVTRKRSGSSALNGAERRLC